MSGMTEAGMLAALERIEYSMDGFIKRYPEEDEYRAAMIHLSALIAERDALRNAAVQSLDDFCWAEQTVPGTNFQASILLLRHALKFQEAEQANVRT